MPSFALLGGHPSPTPGGSCCRLSCASCFLRRGLHMPYLSPPGPTQLPLPVWSRGTPPPQQETLDCLPGRWLWQGGG